MAQDNQRYIEKINSSSGMYFDPVGELQINTGNLDIIVPIDTSYILPHIENLNTIIKTVQFTCNHIELNTPINLECQNVLEPLTVRYNDLVSAFSSISHLTTHRSKRSAWIGGIGTLSKTIFGTLNEDDAIKYDNAINSIQNNELKLSSLLKENILVTTSIVSKFNTTLYKIKTNEISLNRAIDKLSSIMQNSTMTQNKLIIKSKINSILNSLEATIITLSFQIEDITNSIIFGSQNIIHPSILSPTELYQELVNNYIHFSTNCKLPVKLELSNIHMLMNISRVSCYSYKNRIIFILRVPLVSPKNFNLYHSIALPTPHVGKNPYSFSYIKPNNKFIAMTNDKQDYCVLESLKDCITLKSYIYICDVKTTFSANANPCCESELITKALKSKPVQCNTNFIYGKLDLWKPINNNKWIFIQTQNNKLNIECPNNTLVETNIIGTGILNIPYNCVAYCKNTRLTPSFNNIKINVPVVHTEFNIINDTCCNPEKVQEQLNNESPISLQNIDLDTFTFETKSKLKYLSHNTDNLINENHILKYGTHYSIITILILSLIIVFSVIKFYFYVKNKDNNRLPFRFPSINPIPRTAPNPDPIPPAKPTKPRSSPEQIPLPNIRKNT